MSHMKYDKMHEEVRALYKIYREGQEYIFIAGSIHKEGHGVKEFFEVQNEDGEKISGSIAEEILKFGYEIIG